MRGLLAGPTQSIGWGIAPCLQRSWASRRGATSPGLYDDDALRFGEAAREFLLVCAVRRRWRLPSTRSSRARLPRAAGRPLALSEPHDAHESRAVLRRRPLRTAPRRDRDRRV